MSSPPPTTTSSTIVLPPPVYQVKEPKKGKSKKNKKNIENKESTENASQPLGLRETNTRQYDKEQKKKSDFYNIYFFRNYDTGKLTIATRINRRNVPADILQQFITELRVQGFLKHKTLDPPDRYVLPAHAATNTGLYVIYSTTPVQPLKSLISKFNLLNDFDRLVFERLYIIIIGIVSGLSYLHQNGLVHGNLRVESIYLDENDEPKMFNYDFPELYPKQLIDNRDLKSKYTAPELFDEYIITEKVDVYAFGVVLAKIVLGKELFKEFWETKAFPSLPEEKKYVKFWFNLIRMCIQESPQKRPSIFDIERVIFDNVYRIPRDAQGAILNYVDSIVEYNPNCKLMNQSEFSFEEKIMPTINPLMEKLLFFKDINSGLYDFMFNYTNLQFLLQNVLDRNIDSTIMWIMLNMNVKDADTVMLIGDELLKTCYSQYMNISRIAAVAKGLIKNSLDTNALPLLRDYFLVRVIKYSRKLDPYPNCIPYYAFIKYLFLMDIYANDDLSRVVREILKTAPSASFALTAFCWFKEQVEKTCPAISQQLVDLIQNGNVREVFKDFLNNKYPTEMLAIAIRNDNFKAYKKYVRKNPSLGKMAILPSVFDVCPYAHDHPTPLLYAALYGASKIIICMQSTGMNFDATDDKKRNLSVMATAGNLGLFFANSNDLSQPNQFATAIRFHRNELFFDNNFIQYYNLEKSTMQAIAKYNNIFAFLLTASFIKNPVEESVATLFVSPGLFGKTILHIVVDLHNIAFLKILTSFKLLQVNATDSWGQTALHIACQNGSCEAVKLLLRANGINVNARDEKGNTPLHYAARNDFADIVEALVKASGINPSIKNGKGKTPLHLAAKGNCSDSYKALLLGRCDPTIEDNDGKTSYEIAVERGNNEVLSVAELIGRNESCCIF